MPPLKNNVVTSINRILFILLDTRKVAPIHGCVCRAGFQFIQSTQPVCTWAWLSHQVIRNVPFHKHRPWSLLCHSHSLIALSATMLCNERQLSAASGRPRLELASDIYSILHHTSCSIADLRSRVLSRSKADRKQVTSQLRTCLISPATCVTWARNPT